MDSFLRFNSRGTNQSIHGCNSYSMNHPPLRRIIVLVLLSALECIANDDSYGTEVSWPMQHASSSKFHVAYDRFMQDCAERYSFESCEQNDYDRIQLNARQPAWQKNFTNTGYAVVSITGTTAWDRIERFWQKQRYTQTKEYWEHGSIYTNHWESPTYKVEFPDGEDKNSITEQVQSVLETWSKTPLVLTSVYGVRVYTNHSILSPHVDRCVILQYSLLFRLTPYQCPTGHFCHSQCRPGSRGGLDSRSHWPSGTSGQLDVATGGNGPVRKPFGDSWATLRAPGIVLCQSILSF